jgi:hypothetical protein
MSVSDAQFWAWLRNGAPRLVLLAELKFAYETASGPAEGTTYLSSRQYRTSPLDSPANTAYRAVIANSPEFSRSINLQKLGGRTELQIGSLVLNNTNGAVDFLLDAIVDARAVSFYVGDAGDAASGLQPWARSDFRAVGTAVMAAVRASNDEELVVDLHDKTYLLDVTVVGPTIATGPNAGKPKPLVLGRARNLDISPFLLDAVTLTYAINGSGLSTSVNSGSSAGPVRDRGSSLSTTSFYFFDNTIMSANAGTDTLTSTTPHLLNANDVIQFRGTGGGAHSLFTGLVIGTQYWVLGSGLTANDFKLSLTQGGAAVDITGTVLTGAFQIDQARYYVDAAAGTLQLSTTSAGLVTADVFGTLATAGIHGAFKYLIQTYSGLAASEYDTTSMDALAAIEVLESGNYGRAILDRMNLLTLLDEIATASGSWYGWDASGVLKVGRLDLANLDAATSVDTITTSEIMNDIDCQNLPVPFGRVVVDTRANYAVQTSDFNGAVTASDRSKYGQQFQKRTTSTDPATTSYLANWWDYHKSATDSAPMPIWGFEGAEQAMADRLAALYGPYTRAFHCVVSLDKYFRADGTVMSPGDCVTLTYPRYGLSSGKNMRVASVQPQFTADPPVCDVMLVRKAVPDYTSTTH